MAEETGVKPKEAVKPVTFEYAAFTDVTVRILDPKVKDDVGYPVTFERKKYGDGYLPPRYVTADENEIAILRKNPNTTEL